MKLFKETHNETDLAVIQYGGGTICTVEPIEITEVRNIISDAMDKLAMSMNSPGDVDVSEHVDGLLSKLKGDGE